MSKDFHGHWTAKGLIRIAELLDFRRTGPYPKPTEIIPGLSTDFSSFGLKRTLIVETSLKSGGSRAKHNEREREKEHEHITLFKWLGDKRKRGGVVQTKHNQNIVTFYSIAAFCKYPLKGGDAVQRRHHCLVRTSLWFPGQELLFGLVWTQQFGYLSKTFYKASFAESACPTLLSSGHVWTVWV